MTYHALAHPFTLDGAGHVATVEQGTEGWADQCLQVTVGTVVGERDMAWAFGIPDPAWHGVEPDDVQSAVNQYGPDGVTVTDVTTTFTTDTSATVALTWEWATPDEVDADIS